MALDDRIKLFICEQRGTIVGVLVLLGVGCLVGAGYIYITPTVDTFTEETNVQTVETEVETSAVVTGETALYRQGQRLENRSLYFFDVTPVLTFTIRTQVPEDESVTIAHNLTLEIVGVRNNAPFYREQRTILEEETTTSDGEVVVESEFDAAALREDLQEIQGEISQAGEFRMRLTLNVSYDTGTYEDTLTPEAPFVFSGDAYFVDGGMQAERRHSTTEVREVRSQSTILEYGGLGMVGLVLLGLAPVVIRVADRVDPERLRVNIVHDRHDEWISRGEFPTESDKQYISILALEDLVDVAIDSSRRVIFDPELDAYAVIDGDEIYYYAHDERDTDAWLDL